MRVITQISGVIGVVRMIGTIDGVDKVIYIYMDTCSPVNFQTECIEQMKSINIVEFIKEMLFCIGKKGEKQFDIFIEQTLEHIEYIQDLEKKEPFKLSLRANYKNRILKLFAHMFSEVDREHGVLKVSVPKNSSNIRYNYYDIRDSLDQFSISEQANAIINELYAAMTPTFNITPDLIPDLIKEHQILLTLQSSEEKSINLLKKIKGEILLDDKIILDRYLDKIMNRYESPTVRDNIRKQLIDMLEIKITDLLQKIDLVKEEIQQFKSDFTSTMDPEIIRTYFDKIISAMIQFINADDTIIAILSDGVALRRIADKKYIKNVFYYGSVFHCVNIIRMCIEGFNFKITHSSIHDLMSLEDTSEKVIYEKIKLNTSSEDQTTIYQCSDISSIDIEQILNIE